MNQPLLSRDSSFDESLPEKAVRLEIDDHHPQRQSRTRRWLVPAMAHLALITLYTIAFIVALRHFQCNHGPDLVYSPARKAVAYESQAFTHDSKKSPYVGQPSADVDLAWHNLLQWNNVRVSEGEMAEIDPSGERAEQAIALPDGGYFAGLTVTHELHCLKRLYQYMYPEYYFADISAADREANRVHNGHCIDMLRQSVMCHGDISPITMRWGHKQRIPLANFTTPHECVKWDAIVDWSKERQIPRLTEPGWLQHPTFGTVYEEGFENKIGQVHDD